VGRGREVILEGGKRPREERPIEGVNNAGSGERIHRKLTSSEPRRRKVENGMEDSSVREDRAATGGEKPLKGGCPWTNRPEIRLADPRRETSRARQTRSVGELPQGRVAGRASVDGKASEGPAGEGFLPGPRKRERAGRSGGDAAGAVTTLVHEQVAPAEELDEGVLRASGERVAADRFRTRRRRA